MRTKMKWLAAIGMIMILLLTVCAATAEGVSETLQVSISTKGTPPETPETYTVRLTADGDFPMPAGYQTGADGKYTDLTITGAASKSFPSITYERPGIYTYTVKQIPGTAEGVTYDSSVYDVKVQVYNNEAGTGFEIATAIRKQGSKDKTPITFVNIYPVELISKTVTKNWDDADNQDGIRPDELTATLTNSDGMDPIPVTLNAENNWTATVEKLPRFKEDTRDEITYTWEEGVTDSTYTPEGVSTEGNITVFTNKHVPYTTEASVEKIWDDANNQDGIRPKGETVVRVVLLADGVEKQKVYLSEANEWKATVTGLPKNEKGKEIKYTWKEDSKTVGYDLTGNVTSGQLTTLVNTHVTEKTTATIVKSWDDGYNQDGLRPESIEMTLSNGTKVTLNADNNWHATVENLPRFENGKEIVYTWKEGQMPAGYTLTDNSADGTVTTITNTHTPETKEIKIQKVWVDEEDKDGLRKPVTLVLTASANQTAVATYTWKVEDADTLTHTFTVPVYNKGVELKYTVDEETVPAGYVKTVDNSTLTVTNTHEVISETVDIQISKSWNDDNNRDGVRPENIVVQVMRNGKEYNTVTVTGTGNLWSYTMTGLPKYDENHAEYAYTISEVKVPGYTSAIQGFAITNTHAIATTAQTVTKVWNDNNNANRPASVTVTLNANGKAVGNVTLDAANNWTATIDNLPVNENGKAITYTWTEGAVAGYRLSNTTVTTTADGDTTTLTNTLNPVANPVRHRLRIYYRYLDGSEAAPTVDEEHAAGDRYDVDSPKIEGYRASQANVNGIMPNYDVEYVVLYLPVKGVYEIITDYDTPLAIGEVYINIGECFE